MIIYMKKVLLLVFMLIFLVGCGKNENELIMVTEAGFAPYEYYDNGEIVGVDVDIANEIAKEMGKKLVVKDVAFDSIINEVKTGKADFGAAGISYSDERAEEVDFSVNYSVSKQVVIVKENSSITSPYTSSISIFLSCLILSQLHFFKNRQTKLTGAQLNINKSKKSIPPILSLILLLYFLSRNALSTTPIT